VQLEVLLWNQHAAIGVPVIHVPLAARYIVVAHPSEFGHVAPATQAVTAAEPVVAATEYPTAPIKQSGAAVVPPVMAQLAILVMHCPASNVDPVAQVVHVKAEHAVPARVPAVQRPAVQLAV